MSQNQHSDTVASWAQVDRYRYIYVYIYTNIYLYSVKLTRPKGGIV